MDATASGPWSSAAPSPTAVTTPAPSKPSTIGRWAGSPGPPYSLASIGFTPAARSETMAWPGPGSGSSTSCSSRTSGPPKAAATTRRAVVGMPGQPGGGGGHSRSTGIQAGISRTRKCGLYASWCGGVGTRTSLLGPQPTVPGARSCRLWARKCRLPSGCRRRMPGGSPVPVPLTGGDHPGSDGWGRPRPGDAARARPRRSSRPTPTRPRSTPSWRGCAPSRRWSSRVSATT